MDAANLGWYVFAVPAVLGALGFPLWLFLRWWDERRRAALEAATAAAQADEGAGKEEE